MPWVRKYHRSGNGYWVVGIVAGVVFGLFLGYAWWGSTAAVVAVVEKELNSTESHITNLENRVMQLEARLASQQSNHVVDEEYGEDGKNAADFKVISSRSEGATARPNAGTR
jgi:hypothetical protein